MSGETLAEQARGLRTDVADLATSVTALADRTEQSERTVARMRRLTVALVVGLVLIVGLGVYLVVLNRQLNSFSRCQAEYNTINNQRTRALTEATAPERAAERRVIDLFFSALFDPSVRKPAAERTAEDRERIAALTAEIGTAAQRLKAERAQADKARADHPVPPPPSQLCTP